jgi:nitroreductase
MNILEALHWRYATNQFSDEVISDKQLRQLLNATILSASSFGLQPYRMIVVSSTELKTQLAAVSMGQDKASLCSHLIVFVAEKNMPHTRIDQYIQKLSTVRGTSLEKLQGMSEQMKAALSYKNEAQMMEWAKRQTYLALGNFLTCAASMKIDSCPMEGIELDDYDNILDLSAQGLTTVAACPIGYRHKDDHYAGFKKVRFDYDELVLPM